MNKINKMLFSLVFVLIIFLIPSKVFAGANDVQTLEIDVEENGKINFKGTTIGGTDNMNLLVKIFDGKSLEFFDQVVVNNNKFSFSATPIKAKLNTDLKIVITGDLSYEGTFYYSSKYSDLVEEIEQESINLLEKYAIYYDDVIPTKLKFDIRTSFNGDVLFVYLNGTNFKSTDSNWLNKDASTWNTFLSTITTKGYEISQNSTVYVYIYDQNGKFLQSFPKGADDAIKDEEDKDDSSSDDGNNEGEDSDKEETKPVDKNIITETILDNLLKDNNQYLVDSFTYIYDYSLISATSSYIKIKAQGNFNKKDNSWSNVNTSKMEAFFDTCALKIKSAYNVDIDFILYDKNDVVLTAYNYYIYDEDDNNTSSGSQGSQGSTSTSQPEINENYVPENNLNKIPDEYELDPEYQFVPWNDKRATGLVLALYLSDYGYNSGAVIPNVKEETVNGHYVYNLSVDADRVSEVLNSLRSDAKKIAYVKKQTDSNNITLELPINTVNTLKESNALFIFDTDFYRIELDFADYSGVGPIVIETSEANVSSDDYAKPLTLTIKDNGRDANNSFSNGIKCLIHYESDKTNQIRDLRSINVYNSNGMIINSTSTTLEKGFVFRYNGADTYYAKNNQFTFTDSSWENSMSKRYAELIASKGIMTATNNGLFNAEKTLTRGEFIYYLACKMGAFSTTQRFKNVDSSHPYYTAINGIYELGIMPTTFRSKLDSEKEITREEMIYMMVRCYEINNSNESIKSASLLYRDKNEISVWAKAKIGMASKIGLIEDDGYLYPKEVGNREFAANLFYNLLVAEGIF